MQDFLRDDPLARGPNPIAGSNLARARDLLEDTHANRIASKQKLRQVEAIRRVRLKRESRSQNIGFSSRPFVLCGLPIKKPAQGVLLHER